MVMNLERAIANLKSGMEIHAIYDFNMRNGCTGSLPPSAAKLATDMGFAVGLIALPRGMSGRLVADATSKRGVRIEVNEFQFIEDKRLAVLHELAHGLKHVDPDDPMPNPIYFDETSLEYDWKSDRREREAQEFVSAISFGNLALKTAVAINGRNIAALGRWFGLPRAFVQNALSRIDSYDK